MSEPLDRHSEIFRQLTIAVRDADLAYQKAGETGTRDWIENYFLPALTERGLTVQLEADALTAQERVAALEGALDAIVTWWETTHGNELAHDHHCYAVPFGEGEQAVCTCGWAKARTALMAESAVRAALSTTESPEVGG